MQLHNISKPKSHKKGKRIARGGKRGTYSGRGIKGQKSRSGGNIRPGFEGKNTTSVARSPKLVGFKSPNLPNEIVSLETLDRKFKSGDKVTPEVLKEEGIVRLNKKGRAKKIARVKILGTDKLTKKLTIENCLASKKARKVIEKAGGKIVEEKKKIRKPRKTKKGK